jgi:hypothetical protein
VRETLSLSLVWNGSTVGWSGGGGFRSSMPSTSDVPSAASESANALAYQWLLALGFPPEAAAASLMPELFTEETRPPESRPGRPRIQSVAGGERVQVK